MKVLEIEPAGSALTFYRLAPKPEHEGEPLITFWRITSC
jgi:hypothetical protein